MYDETLGKTHFGSLRWINVTFFSAFIGLAGDAKGEYLIMPSVC